MSLFESTAKKCQTKVYTISNTMNKNMFLQLKSGVLNVIFNISKKITKIVHFTSPAHSSNFWYYIFSEHTSLPKKYFKLFSVVKISVKMSWTGLWPNKDDYPYNCTLQKSECHKLNCCGILNQNVVVFVHILDQYF